MELQTLILLCTGGLALLIILCSYFVYNGLNYDIRSIYGGMLNELREAKQDIEDEIDKIDIPSHYCNFPDPDERDDDYF